MVCLFLNLTLAIFPEERNSIYRVLGHPWSFLGHREKGRILNADCCPVKQAKDFTGQGKQKALREKHQEQTQRDGAGVRLQAKQR